MESGPAECQIEGEGGLREGMVVVVVLGAGGGVTREGDEGMRRRAVGRVDTAG